MSETIRISNDDLAVDVSSLGAEMQSITTRDGRDMAVERRSGFWTGRSPVLFPIVGKAPEIRC